MTRCRRLSLPNCYLFFSLFFSSVLAKEWMSPAPVEIYVPQNLRLGDEIVGESPLRINEDADELVAVSLSPSSDAVSLAPGTVKPGEVFRLILKDRDALLNEFSIQCLGVYSGNLQEIPLRFVLDNVNANSTLRFEREHYDLKLDSPLLEKEIALIKMTGVVPSWARFTLNGPLSQHFSVYTESGVVIVASIPCKDCVLEIPKQFSILLTYLGSETSITVLSFSIENNRRLRFEHSYEAEIEEGANSFKRVVKLKATGGKPTYSLDDPSGLFSVHPRTGILTLQHPEFVNIETAGETVILNATASEGDQKVRTTVTIKITPKVEVKGFRFEKEQYKLTVLAGQQLANGAVRVSGGTGNVTYRISEGPQAFFTVTDGLIAFTGDFPTNDQKYSLLVLAETQDRSTVAVTRVDVTVMGINSHIIRLKSARSVSVIGSADSEPGLLLHTIEVTDEDKDHRIEYLISNVTARDFDGNMVEVPNGAIELVPKGQKAEVRLKIEIGDDEWLGLQTIIEARDAAHSLESAVFSKIEVLLPRKELIKKPELPLRIIETPTSIVIPSSLPEGSYVYQLRTSPIVNVTFSLGSESEIFNLDEITGVISTNRVLPSSPSKEILQVIAKTVTQTASKNVTVEVTDSTEKIPKLMQHAISMELPVTADIGTVVANLTVVNNVPVTFSPLEGSDLFLIDAKGVIVTGSVLSPDVSNYILFTKAIGKEGSADATINVSVDLDAAKKLRFNRDTYTFKSMQNILVNSYVGDVHLQSKGDIPVRYSIRAEEGQEQLLDIDDEGRISAREELDKAGSERRYRVTASDGKRRAETEVVVKIQPAFDCEPELIKGENDVFYINENTPPGSQIGHVSAKPLDAKCDLTYFFWNFDQPTQELDFAAIDWKTGEIKSRTTFDFEETRTYSLVLGLKAGMRQTLQHGAVLMIRDQDDHPIRFQHDSVTVEISESSAPGSLVTTATAVEPDASQSIFYRIRQEDDKFAVDRETGEIRLSKPLDRETEDRYTVEIGASNSPDVPEGEVKAWLTVRVVVRDENDNGPIFDRGHYEVLLDKMTLPGRTVARVHAVDPDLSESEKSPTVFYSLADSQFEYRGTSRSMRGYFFVEQRTGAVILLEPVNESAGGLFHLKIQAADGLEPTSRKSLTSLRVIIHDDSDVILSELPKRPESVVQDDVHNITQTIANATGLRVLVKDVRYHEREGIVLNKVTDVRMVLVNRTTFEIVPAEKAMSMVHSSEKKMEDMPVISKAQVPIFDQDTSNFPPPILFVAFVFVLLFIVASAIMAVLLCHYRARYRREKQNFEDHRIIRNSLEDRPQPRRPSPPSPPRMPSPEEDEKMGYMSQERKMSVWPDEGRTKA